jgi:hypothetical protein
MSEWTEYHPGLDWPEGDNVEWQFKNTPEWLSTDSPKYWWEYGFRIRFCIPEVKTKGDLELEAWNIVAHKQYFSARQTFSDGFHEGWQAARENPEVE